MRRLALAAALVIGTLGLWACGDDDATPGVVSNQPPEDMDAGSTAPDEPPDIIRDPNANLDVPPELKDQKCAVETDKLFQLSSVHRQPESTQLSADLVRSRFAISYVGESETCVEAIYVALLQGSSDLGKPVVSTALDPCTTIKHAALAHNGQAWLLGSVDTRMGAQDFWIQTLGDDGTLGKAQRISDTPGEESEPSVALSSDGHLLAAWTERDELMDSAELLVRPLSSLGGPLQDAVTLESGVGITFGSLSVSALGKFIALAYRRSETSGAAEIFLDVLDPLTGERVREPWRLTGQASRTGSVDVAGDAEGGGVAFSIVDPPSYQVWFQALGADGAALPVQSAGQTGGPSAAVRVVGPPYRAIDASIAKVPAGYALAYRALEGGLVAQAQIRIHFLDRSGRDGGASSVALASIYGGRTGIETGYDGRVVIAWNDGTDAGDTNLMAVRVPCISER